MQGREGALGHLKIYTFNIGFHSDTYYLISFKFQIVLDTTKRYSSIPVWMTLTFTEGHWD